MASIALLLVWRYDWSTIFDNYNKCKDAELNEVDGYPGRVRWFWSYVRLLWWRRSLRDPARIEENAYRKKVVPGFPGIFYSTANDLACLFEEIFLLKYYYFEASSSEPFIVDCGGNIGVSVIFFKMLYPNAKILAFEPSRRNFEALKKNIVSNNLKDVEIVNKALSDREGPSWLHGAGLALGSMIIERDGQKEGQKEEIHTVRLSDYVDREIDLLKLDIEGMEAVVIQDLADNDKLKFIKEMVIEVHYEENELEGNFSKLINLFEGNGFVYQVRGQKLIPVYKEKLSYIILVQAYNRRFRN
ncbi:MAG: FkbM family methyltransferase [Pseudomonadota bacterium]